jgi:hypothetical protein
LLSRAFLIERPRFFPLFLACYGHSPFMVTVFETVKRVSNFLRSAPSDSFFLPNFLQNLIQCHEGEFDLLLLAVLTADSPIHSNFRVSASLSTSFFPPLLCCLFSSTLLLSAVAYSQTRYAFRWSPPALEVFSKLQTIATDSPRQVFALRSFHCFLLVIGFVGSHFSILSWETRFPLCDI